MKVLYMVIKMMSGSYEGLLALLTQSQVNLLKAVAKAEPVAQPLNGDFIKRYDLPATSTIKSILNVLQNKDLVYRTAEGYVVYDRFFSLWLKRTFGLY